MWKTNPDERQIGRAIAQHLNNLGILVDCLEERLNAAHIAKGLALALLPLDLSSSCPHIVQRCFPEAPSVLGADGVSELLKRFLEYPEAWA